MKFKFAYLLEGKERGSSAPPVVSGEGTPTYSSLLLLSLQLLGSHLGLVFQTVVAMTGKVLAKSALRMLFSP